MRTQHLVSQFARHVALPPDSRLSTSEIQNLFVCALDMDRVSDLLYAIHVIKSVSAVAVAAFGKRVRVEFKARLNADLALHKRWVNQLVRADATVVTPHHHTVDA